MAKKIEISSACVGCGLCFVSPYIEETMEGFAKPAGGGIIPKAEETEFEEIIEECPQNAITLSNIEQKTRREIYDIIDHSKEAFKLDDPDYDEVSFDSRYCAIRLNIGRFVSGFIPTRSKAYDAARGAINEVYETRTAKVQEMISLYSRDKLWKYYNYEETAGNFYFEANQAAQELLNKWVRAVQSSKIGIVPPRLTIQTRPHTENMWVEEIKQDILRIGNTVVNNLKGEYYSLSYYVKQSNVKIEEAMAKTLFHDGNYIYSYQIDGILEMQKDLNNALCRNAEDIEEYAYNAVQHIVHDYEDLLKEELDRKANELKNLLK